MKSILYHLLVFILSASLLSICSCSKENKTPAEYLWSVDNIGKMGNRSFLYDEQIYLNVSANNPVKAQMPQVLTYSESFNSKLSFYHGPKPLQFKSAKTPGLLDNALKCISYDFKYFKNSFIYTNWLNAIPDGARTYDSNGSLIAEAKVNSKKQSLSFEIQEQHYDADGNLIFNAISTIDALQGVKTSEKVLSGKKKRDYYFVWPSM